MPMTMQFSVLICVDNGRTQIHGGCWNSQWRVRICIGMRQKSCGDSPAFTLHIAHCTLTIAYCGSPASAFRSEQRRRPQTGFAAFLQTFCPNLIIQQFLQQNFKQQAHIFGERIEYDFIGLCHAEKSSSCRLLPKRCSFPLAVKISHFVPRFEMSRIKD